MGDLVPINAAVAKQMQKWEPLYTKKELAEHLRVSERWIEMQVSDGMPTCRLGRRTVRFRVGDVEEWLDVKRAG